MKKDYPKWEKSREFGFLSDAMAFQRRMQRQGCTTKKECHLGIMSPYTVVYFKKKSTL